jgi:prolyl-tRNA synthetase
MRTRLFLRTAEFLWQEGHTAHATKERAWKKTMKMVNVYADFAENFLALSVIKGHNWKMNVLPELSTLFVRSTDAGWKSPAGRNFHFLVKISLKHSM